jgi:hypothetical protein
MMPVPLPLLARIRNRLHPMPGRKFQGIARGSSGARRSRGFGAEWCEFAPGPVGALIREERAKPIELGIQSQTQVSPQATIASLARMSSEKNRPAC